MEARVPTNAGMDIFVTRRPFKRPTAAPTAIGTRIARTGETGASTIKKYPESANTELTERSMEPHRITNVIPIDTIPMILAERRTLPIFSAV